ncbi:unnamed protein product [Lepeophtheirus salmonis]|uniref:(salmon louse) hypothetical protein n=1 Tax=Lepeophtheirus salmonis TaxID=72036 RepID=A0A7R8H505_LEPSM|nr:unnamed protein product [Lepeophtheirus salmonis]CAF2853861.1 unnamed protein product [Lepeophtheirus salmonis]
MITIKGDPAMLQEAVMEKKLGRFSNNSYTIREDVRVGTVDWVKLTDIEMRTLRSMWLDNCWEGLISLAYHFADYNGISQKKKTCASISAKEKPSLGYKVAKDRLTLLLGGNVGGDFGLKPMLEYCTENPRALKGHSKILFRYYGMEITKYWVT